MFYGVERPPHVYPLTCSWTFGLFPFLRCRGCAAGSTQGQRLSLPCCLLWRHLHDWQVSFLPDSLSGLWLGAFIPCQGQLAQSQQPYLWEGSEQAVASGPPISSRNISLCGSLPHDSLLQSKRLWLERYLLLHLHIQIPVSSGWKAALDAI